VFELVVDRLDVGDADSLLQLDPVGGLAQDLGETLELRHGVVRPAGVQPRRHEVRATFTTKTKGNRRHQTPPRAPTPVWRDRLRICHGVDAVAPPAESF